MTEGKDLKRLVRQRMAKTGESYTTARAHFRPPVPREPQPEEVSVAAFRDGIYTRSGLDRLGAHLEARYGAPVTKLTELDVGVFRADRRDAPAWVARVFPAARPVELVEGDADILRHLEANDFRAERCADDEAVSVLDDQGVLVTEYVLGMSGRTDTNGQTLFDLGEQLGRLQTLPSAPRGHAARREAGSWHHISVRGGSVRNDADTLLALLATIEAGTSTADPEALDRLRERLRDVDDCIDLPTALSHPDPCGANAVVPPLGSPVLVDWTGAGTAPRALGLARLVAGTLSPSPGAPISDALQRVDAVVAGYRRHVTLDADELERMEPAITSFPVMLGTWMHLFQNVPIDAIENMIAGNDRMATAASQRVAEAFDRDVDELTAWFSDRPAEVHPGQGTLL
ncbi:MAG TPA: phosphotransferase [Acidimicrobiales bacterium]